MRGKSRDPVQAGVAILAIVGLALSGASLSWIGPAERPDTTSGALGDPGGHHLSSEIGATFRDLDGSPVDVARGAEPIIEVGPQGRNLWTGFYRSLVDDHPEVYRSTDGGETWEPTDPPFPVKNDGIDIAVDDAGRLYAASMAGSTLQVARSSDGGDTWDVFHPALSADALVDRPWIAAGPGDQVAVTYFGSLGEACFRSFNHGVTYPDFALQGPAPAGNLAFGPDGNLFYEASEFNPNPMTLWKRPSCSGEPRSLTVLQDHGPQVFTQVAADEHAVYSAAPSTDGDLLVAGTEDFRTPTVRRVDLPLANNTFVTIDAQQGNVTVAWYGTNRSGDFREGDFGGSWHVYAATIDSFWTAAASLSCDDASVTCYRVTKDPNHVGDICFSGCSDHREDADLLDYFGVSYGPDGAVHVAFTDDAEEGADTDDPWVRYARIPAPRSG